MPLPGQGHDLPLELLATASSPKGINAWMSATRHSIALGASPGGTIVYQHDVTRGITTIAYGGVTQVFDYDGFQRLSFDSVSSGSYGPTRDSLTYDAAGNRTGTTGSYAYSATNAALVRPSTGGDSYAPGDSISYDAAGNPLRWRNNTNGQYDSLTWDAENRLIRHRRYTSGGSGVFDIAYAYDGLGRRVMRTSGSSDTLYVWDGWDLLAETTGNGTALRRYTHNPQQVDFPLAMREGGSTYYLHRDGQGNVYKVTNTSGTVRAHYRYRAWGDRYNVSTEIVASPFTYKGREEDRTTGLIYMRHRYYSPRLERFLNEDPTGIEGGLNVYAFAMNSPCDLADPMGLDPCEGAPGAIGDPNVQAAADRMLELHDESGGEWSAIVYQNADGSYQADILSPLEFDQVGEHMNVINDVPVDDPSFYGTMHTHGSNDMSGLGADINRTWSRNDYHRLVATPNQLHDIGVYLSDGIQSCDR